jgi:thioester reductase-like protein
MAAGNYFICTLGQAAYHPKTTAGSIPEFLELQAALYGQRPAVGFPGLLGKSTSLLTFQELNEQTKEVASRLVSMVPMLKKSLGRGCTIALLAHSHVVFLKAWLGLIRLGFSVLLLAPQLDKASIEHLCRECDVKYLFHDSDHAQKARETEGPTRVQLEADHLAQRRRDGPDMEMQIDLRSKVFPIPYLHHSSGTSSGKPKAIPQTNAAAFAALPSIDRSPGAATFSSTPLYHGGVADCFRAWTSGQMIWMFPGGEKPITSQTVLACLAVADEHSSNGSTSPVRYFSSVPYVLRDLATNDEGMNVLRRMDIVGVGGAAFPSTLGQKLVNEGVHLVSRYGSAECGFLLSSYRDFDKDKDWDYLRADTGAEHLSFEPKQNGLFELVVESGWPHMAKTNRENGSYATADLLERHPTKPNAWRYHSRADAQITLVNGKKFDPEPVESAILTQSDPDLLLDVLVFGDGENYPGALVFARKGSDLSPLYLVDQIWKTIDQVNQQNPSHARLSKNMIKVIVHQNENVSPLGKSSKGTIMRGKAHERYHNEVRQMYDDQSTGPEVEQPVNNRSDLITAIAHIVERTTGESLTPGQDFFEQGIDSVACIQIRKAIQNLIFKSQNLIKNDRGKDSDEIIAQRESNCLGTSPFRDGGELPSNLLYDCGTIDMVATFLLGQSTTGQEKDIYMMKKLAEKYSQFDMLDVAVNSVPTTRKDKGLVILLTGATGALGTHLLNVLRSRSDVEQVYCLLRASDPLVAHQRLDKALKSKSLEGLQPMGTVDEKIVCIPCNLAQEDLGIEEPLLREIKSNLDMIVHAAWAVNFTLRLKSFEFHLAGTQNLLNLGFAAGGLKHASSPHEDMQKQTVKFAFCSSIASVSSPSSTCVAENVSENPSDASSLGYSRSKWVAEAICVHAHRTAQGAGIPLEVEILRIGQLCGDSSNGVWNQTEAWPLMLSTFHVVGRLPDLPNESLNWLPLDIAANAIQDVVFYNGPEKKTFVTETPVYHILNPHSTPSWAEMLCWLREKEGDRLHVVEPAAWLQSLENWLAKDGADHPSRKLLGLWAGAYQSSDDTGKMKPEFTVTKAASVSSTMRSVAPVSRDLVVKMWAWIRTSTQTGSQDAEI